MSVDRVPGKKAAVQSYVGFRWEAMAVLHRALSFPNSREKYCNDKLSELQRKGLMNNLVLRTLLTTEQLQQHKLLNIFIRASMCPSFPLVSSSGQCADGSTVLVTEAEDISLQQWLQTPRTDADYSVMLFQVVTALLVSTCEGIVGIPVSFDRISYVVMEPVGFSQKVALTPDSTEYKEFKFNPLQHLFKLNIGKVDPVPTDAYANLSLFVNLFREWCMSQSRVPPLCVMFNSFDTKSLPTNKEQLFAQYHFFVSKLQLPVLGPGKVVPFMYSKWTICGLPKSVVLQNMLTER